MDAMLSESPSDALTNEALGIGVSNKTLQKLEDAKIGTLFQLVTLTTDQAKGVLGEGSYNELIGILGVCDLRFDMTPEDLELWSPIYLGGG